MNKKHNKESLFSEWDQVKESWPQMEIDMEIVEKLNKIGHINPILSRGVRGDFKK